MRLRESAGTEALLQAFQLGSVSRMLCQWARPSPASLGGDLLQSPLPSHYKESLRQGLWYVVCGLGRAGRGPGTTQSCRGLCRVGVVKEEEVCTEAYMMRGRQCRGRIFQEEGLAQAKVLR